MKRYIGIDSGKSFTKSAILNPGFLKDKSKKAYDTKMFRTAYEEDATFEDDNPGKETYIVSYEGETYKVGKTATIAAELESSKKTFVHKLCTMLAIAKECSENEVDEVSVAIGIPVDAYLVVKERNNYRDFILPLGEHTVKYRDFDETVHEKTFKIVQRFVYPETIGAIFTSGVNFKESIGVLDIGYLNVNMTIYNNGDVDTLYRRTTTKGANFLVSGLAQELSNELQTVVSKSMAADVICSDTKRLHFRSNQPEKEARSEEITRKYIKKYIRDMLEEIRTKNWPIDLMTLVIIGGGSSMIKDELMEAFGESTIIPEHPNMINAIGFLILMCGREDTVKVKLF